MKKNPNKVLITEPDHRHLLDHVFVKCPICLSTFRAAIYAPSLGAVVECPVCHHKVQVGSRNSRTILTEEVQA